jgi:uncharacterized RDD family membrane protein YckC
VSEQPPGGTGPEYPQYPPPAGPYGPGQLAGAYGKASGPRASFGQRLGAILIDGLIIGVPIVLIVLLLGGSKAIAIAYVLIFVVELAYFVYFEGGTGQTIGKRTTGIRVIDKNTGGSIGYGRAALRFIGRIPSSWVCYLGYLWMLWDAEKQCWHDKIASDYVVPIEAYPIQ